MLKLQFRDRRRESVWLVDKKFTIGKSSTNSLMIDDKSVQEFHVEIKNELDNITIINTAGTPSLLLNGKPVPRHATLHAKDIIKIGDVELELIDPKTLLEQKKSASTTNFTNGWSIYSSASWLEQNRFLIEKTTIVGRDPSCNITLPIEHLSRKHLSLEVRDNQLFLKDLDSSNGTYLNGKRISEAEVHAGDKIKLDVLTFEVSGPAKALDPNRTIIRMAPAPNKTAQAKQANKTANQTSNKPTNKKVKPKRLVSNGKQDWISGQDQANKQVKSHTSKIILGVMIITVCIVAALTLLKL